MHPKCHRKELPRIVTYNYKPNTSNPGMLENSLYPKPIGEEGGRRCWVNLQ